MSENKNLFSVFSVGIWRKTEISVFTPPNFVCFVLTYIWLVSQISHPPLLDFILSTSVPGKKGVTQTIQNALFTLCSRMTGGGRGSLLKRDGAAILKIPLDRTWKYVQLLRPDHPVTEHPPSVWAFCLTHHVPRAEEVACQADVTSTVCLGREANLEITVVGLKPVFDDSGVVEHGKEYLLMNKLGMRPTVKAQVWHPVRTRKQMFAKRPTNGGKSEGFTFDFLFFEGLD